MRAPLIAVLLALPGLAAAGVPVVLAERQVVTLEFTQPVQRLAVSDPEPAGLQASGATVKVTGRRPGRVQIDVVFADGATATYDVSIEPIRVPVARPVAPDELELTVGQERTLPAPVGAQVLLEDNGVARAVQDGRGVTVQGIAAGATTLVVVNPSGARTTWKIRVQ